MLDAKPAIWAAPTDPAPTAAPDAYGLNAQSLRTLLAALPVDRLEAPLTVTNATAWLPTRRGAVVAPADPSGSPVTGSGRIVIQPRAICLALLTGAQAVAIFSECLGRETFGDDIGVGPDAAALGRALRFAFELVAGRNVLPGLAVDAGNAAPQARWQPVLGAAERATYDAIATTLPPVAGALTATQAKSAPRYDARATLDAALAFFVDAAMRWARPAQPRPISANASIHARWMAALAGSEPAFRATPDECAELATAIEAWRRPGIEERAAAYRHPTARARTTRPGT
jgi:hypothetical protein